MITTDMYKSLLSSHGSTMGEVRKNQSDKNINYTFMSSPESRRVYILTKEGWKWEDAKFFRHVKQSISADAADSYLQFRPKVHYPIGSYVIIPDDTSYEINLSEDELVNPFTQPVENRTQWWLIIQRNDTTYPVYNVLKCNWNFQWVKDGKIWESFGCVRDASSYTSGSYWNDYTTTLDNVTSAWVPDTHFVYGDKLSELGMYDTRYILHKMRFLISNNVIDPKAYFISKVMDITPQGVLKLTFKQGEVNAKRDNYELMIADYYNDAGQSNIVPDSSEPPSPEKQSEIFAMVTSSLGILEVDHLIDVNIPEIIKIGETSYFNVMFSDEDIDPEWRIELITDVSESDKEPEYYENLIKVTEFDDITVAVKPSKANSLKGKQFKLVVSDSNGEYESYAVLEVE